MTILSQHEKSTHSRNKSVASSLFYAVISTMYSLSQICHIYTMLSLSICPWLPFLQLSILHEISLMIYMTGNLPLWGGTEMGGGRNLCLSYCITNFPYSISLTLSLLFRLRFFLFSSMSLQSSLTLSLSLSLQLPLSLSLSLFISFSFSPCLVSSFVCSAYPVYLSLSLFLSPFSAYPSLFTVILSLFITLLSLSLSLYLSLSLSLSLIFVSFSCFCSISQEQVYTDKATCSSNSIVLCYNL